MIFKKTIILDVKNDRTDKASVIKTLGHPIRLMILKALYMHTCSVKTIWECLGLQQSVVSQHLAILRNRGIVDCERRGGEVLYSIADPLAQRIIHTVLKQTLPYSDDFHQADIAEAPTDSRRPSCSQQQGFSGCLCSRDSRLATYRNCLFREPFSLA